MKAKPQLSQEAKLQLASLRSLRAVDSDHGAMWQRWLAFQESACIDHDAAWQLFWKQVEQLRRRQAGVRTVERQRRPSGTFLAELAEVESAIIACLKKAYDKPPTQCKVAEALALSHGKDVSDDSFNEFSEARKLRRWLGTLSWDGLVERVWMKFLDMQ